MCFPNLDVGCFTSFTRFQDYLLGSELRNGFSKSQIFRHKIFSNRIRWHRVWEIKQKSIQIFVLAAREWRKDLNAVTEWILHEVGRVLAASNGAGILCDIIFERTRRQTSPHTCLSLERWHFQLKSAIRRIIYFQAQSFQFLNAYSAVLEPISWRVLPNCVPPLLPACAVDRVFRNVSAENMNSSAINQRWNKFGLQRSFSFIFQSRLAQLRKCSSTHLKLTYPIGWCLWSWT